MFLKVLLKSIRNSKRRNKGNFTSKSNSHKIRLCGGAGQHYLVLNTISTLLFHFLGLFIISKWIKQYFKLKMLKKICFSCYINLTIGEWTNKKIIESLNLTRKVNLLRLWRINVGKLGIVPTFLKLNSWSPGAVLFLLYPPRK